MTPATAAVIWIFYAMAPGLLMPMPNSPAFSDQAECLRALEKADPFIPGKSACWPAPWKYEEHNPLKAQPQGDDH
jgi:hypothetical protein